MTSLNTGQSALHPTRGSASTIELESESSLLASQEFVLLREENADLRQKLEELDQLLTLAAQDAEERMAERQREYESLLEEKSEVIRTLHFKNNELRERVVSAPPKVGDGTQLLDNQEVLRLQRELAEERQQMEQDQEAMMGQMRHMEMALAKDRAELARQRAELQRLQDEVKREVDHAARDGGLRERLVAIQRRSNNANGSLASVSQDTPLSTPLPKPPPGSVDKPSKSGLFRRMFGK